MTHRRLLCYFLAICTVVLAVPWGYSLKNGAYADARLPNSQLTVSIFRGTVAFSLSPGGWSGKNFRFHLLPNAYDDAAELKRYSPFGMFLLKLRANQGSSINHSPTVAFPMWMPWLLLVGSGCALVAWRERRIRKGLAEVETGVRNG
jgi:hypothetical protein